MRESSPKHSPNTQHSLAAGLDLRESSLRVWTWKFQPERLTDLWPSLSDPTLLLSPALRLHPPASSRLPLQPRANYCLRTDNYIYFFSCSPRRGMSTYDDDYQPRPRRHHRETRPPYPDDGFPAPLAGNIPTAPDAPPAAAPGATSSSSLPPPPLGSAIKREGSRSRKAHLHPEFPDEASYLNTRSHDLERKNRPDERRFREKRDGYESDEGERHRRAMASSRRPRYDDEDDLPPPPRDRRRRDKDRDADMYGRPPPRDDPYDDRRRPPPRRRHDYSDEESLPPRRKGPRDGVEYGAEPIKPRRHNTEREPPRRRERDPEDRPRRRDKYDDYSDDEDYRPRRRRSEEPPRRRRDDRYDDYDDEPRRPRRDDYGRRKDRDRSRRRYSDDEYDDRRRGDKPPKEIKVGKYDVGPWLEKGQKYYGVVAPIVTPMVMNYLKKKK